MVEISKTSREDFSTNDRLTGCGMLDRKAHVVKIFTSSRKDSDERLVPQKGGSGELPLISPELKNLLSRHKLRVELGNLRPGANDLKFKDVKDSRQVLNCADKDFSHECLGKPTEVASTRTLSLRSPERKYNKCEQELARIKPERLRQRTTLREQVLSGIDIPASYVSDRPSLSILVPKNPGIVNEHDDPLSVSSRSSEENLPFVDATDELKDDEESGEEPFEDKRKASNSSSVDYFTFVHSVHRAKGKHEEAILLRMKYSGNNGARTGRSDDMETPDTVSSNSILGPVPPGAGAEIEEYADLLRKTVRRCKTGATKHRFYDRPPTPAKRSASASGLTTPRRRSRYSSKTSSAPASNTSSKTSLGGRPSTASPPRAMSLPPTQPGSCSVSEQSSPSVSRTISPPPKTQDLSSGLPQTAVSSGPFKKVSETSEFSNQHDLDKSPILESSQCSNCHEYTPSESSRRSIGPNYFTSESPRHSSYHESESPRHSIYNEYPTSESPLRSAYHKHTTSKSPPRSTHNSNLYENASESLPPYDPHEYPTMECGTEDEWPFKVDKSDGNNHKKPLEIPVTIDGRVVYPEVVFAEEAAPAPTQGPLGLLDKVKSFAQNFGPNTKSEAPSPVLQTFSETFPEVGKASAKLNASLLIRLTCVECGLLCTPPVAMCVWGHIICEECRPVSLWESHGKCWCRKRCPQCAGDMLSQPCELWSKIARSLLYPCRFTTNGCREMQGLTPAKKILHEQECLWRQLRCWCPGCSWRGVWHQLRAHVIRIHLLGATHADWYRFVTVCGATQIGRSSDLIALPPNELVLLHSLAIIGEHRYLLQYLNEERGGGTVVLVPRFKLRVISKDGRSEIEVRGEAVPVQYDVERALRSGKCFRLSGTPFGLLTSDATTVEQAEQVTVKLCLEKGRLSVS